MPKQSFKWVVEFSIDETWVEDGFNLTDERARMMLENDLQFAYPEELKVKVIEAPNPDDILRAQGYEVKK